MSTRENIRLIARTPYNNMWPLNIYSMDHPKFIVSNLNEECIRTQRIKLLLSQLHCIALKKTPWCSELIIRLVPRVP